ncbi:MAG: hypothetical protein EKK41_19815 [Hyphomicrobiales bacterium]|nr:MAG: hypothetical protein EKK41_19815 [Hyphomicrobiales bacterium]
MLTARLLGETVFLVDQQHVHIPNRKSRALLAYLFLSDSGADTREQILGLFWSEAEPERARASLRQAIYEVKTTLEDAGFAGFESDNLTIRLRATERRSDLGDVLDGLHSGAVHPGLLQRERITDDLLRDIDGVDPVFGSWTAARRETIRQRIVLGLEKLVTAEPASGTSQAKEAATALLALDPSHELAARALMRMLVEEGNVGGALDVYKRLWNHLDAEFDIEPSEETRALAAEIKLADGAASSPRQPAMPHDAVRVTRIGQPVLAIRLRNAREETKARVWRFVTESTPQCARVPTSEKDMLVVEAQTPVDGGRLGLSLLAPDANLGGIVDAVGLHVVGSDQSDGPDTAVALARLARRGQVVASEAAREWLVEGIDAAIQDLGYLAASGTHGPRAFELKPVAVRALDAGHALMKMHPTLAVVPILPEGFDTSRHVVPLLVAEEIAAELSRSQVIDVISALSSRRLAGRDLLPDDMGQRLGADYIVLADIRTEGAGGRLRVELVDAQTNVMKWQQHADIPALTTEDIKATAERIAHECLAVLVNAQIAHAAAVPLATLDSYRLLFSAMALMDRWTRASFHRAHEHLFTLRQRAPLHHWPNAWLSFWHIRSISQGWSADPKADGSAALDYASIALDSNARCSLAIAMEGWANVYASRRLDVANDRLSLAVEVNNNDSLAWLYKGVTSAFIYKPDEGAEAVERALKLSPIDPRRSYYEALAAGVLCSTDKLERAIELATNSLKSNRLHASAWRALVTAQWYAGKEQEARESGRSLLALEPGFTVERYRRQHPAGDSKYGQRIARALQAAGVP